MAKTKLIEAVELGDNEMSLLFDMPESGAPTEFRVFASGETQTTKGAVLFDEQAGADVMGVLAEHKRDQLPVDYEHGMFAEIKTAETGKAAGWFKPEVRDGELWASDVEWTPKAKAALADREYRFFSPAIEYEKETRRVVRLMNLALTNMPATIGMAPIVASEHTPDALTAEGMEDNMSTLLETLGAKDEAEELKLYETMNSASDSLFTLLSVTTFDAATKAIESLKESAAESLKLAEQVATLECERDNDKKAALIAKLSEDGKAPPSLHGFLSKLTLEQLQEYEGEAPSHDQGDATPPADEPIVIDDSAKKICAATGISVEDFIATRKAEGK